MSKQPKYALASPELQQAWRDGYNDGTDDASNRQERAVKAARLDEQSKAQQMIDDYLKENRSGESWAETEKSRKRGGYELVAFFKGVETTKNIIAELEGK